MGNDDDLIKSINTIFKETYSNKMKDITPDGVRLIKINYSTMSIEELEKWDNEEARKELKKRNSPLWKTLNE